MSHYGLRADVYCCIANGRAAFLDVAADRYFGLPSNLEADFAAFISAGCPSSQAEQSLAPLIRSGLLEHRQDEVPSILARPPTAARLSVFDAPRPRAGILDIGIAVASQVATARALQRHPLKTVLARCGAQKTKAARSQSPPIEAISGFLATRRLIGTQDRCLRWSLAMVAFLSHHRCYPQLVLGVKMAPFAAHAWVQHDDVILNDDVDRVRPYTPILVI